MSNRVLKKLYGDDLKVGPNLVDNHLSDSDSDSLSNDNTKPSKGQKSKKLAINRFELVIIPLFCFECRELIGDCLRTITHLIYSLN